jgi:hypothetical protein
MQFDPSRNSPPYLRSECEQTIHRLI